MTPTSQCVLIVDDDAAVRTVLAAQLGQADIRSIEASSAEEGLQKLETGAVDVMITDLRMPGMDGMELLSRSMKIWPDVPVIVLTAFGTVSVAVEAMRRGAVDFLEKPFTREGVVYAVQSALAEARRLAEMPPAPAGTKRTAVGDSPAMRELRESVERAAASSATVLVRGESGTGKEVVARLLHAESSRSKGPFVAINCAAISESLLEAELFGYVKGAFTGATKDKPGKAELAQGGTLFLDEIGDCPSSIQVKLLRMLQEREVERVGGTRTIALDVRFVAATNKNLEQAILANQFRQDLFFRLSVLPINVPPLRARPADIPPLVRHFLGRSAQANGREAIELEERAASLLSQQPWPGNVRELENFVERLVVFSDGTKVGVADVERELARDRARMTPGSGEARASEPASFVDTVREAERVALVDALKRAGNNRRRAAMFIGLPRRTFYKKLTEHDLLGWQPAQS